MMLDILLCSRCRRSKYTGCDNLSSPFTFLFLFLLSHLALAGSRTTFCYNICVRLRHIVIKYPTKYIVWMPCDRSSYGSSADDNIFF